MSSRLTLNANSCARGKTVQDTFMIDSNLCLTNTPASASDAPEIRAINVRYKVLRVGEMTKLLASNFKAVVCHAGRVELPVSFSSAKNK